MSTTATRLPAAFIRKAPTPIKRKRRGNAGFYQLPFVTNMSVSSPGCWSVPATGGYFGGYETGEAMAMTFMKFLREEEVRYPGRPWLTEIAESFMIRFEQEGGVAMTEGSREKTDSSCSFDSFRGQYVGFFNTLLDWLSVSAKQLGSSLDHIEEKDLVTRANAGLGFDQAAYMASLD